MLNEVLKSCKKMMSTDVKADVKQQEVKEPVAVSCIFYKKYLQKLKQNVLTDMYFSFNFAWDII